MSLRVTIPSTTLAIWNVGHGELILRLKTLVYICMHMCICMCVYICIYIYIYIHTHFMCVYIYMYTYIYIYIYIVWYLLPGHLRSGRRRHGDESSESNPECPWCLPSRRTFRPVSRITDPFSINPKIVLGKIAVFMQCPGTFAFGRRRRARGTFLVFSVLV